MPTFPQQGGSPNTWGTELRNFFQTFFNLATGAFVANSISHTQLADIGTAVHTAIDAFIASKGAPSGLASLDASSHVVQAGAVNPVTAGLASGVATLDGSVKVVQDPANATATPTASKIVMSNASGKLASGWGGDASTLATLDASSKVVQEPASKAQASGIASLNGSSLVVQNPASASATPGANQIPIFDASGNFVMGSLPMILPSATRMSIGKTSIDTAVRGLGATNISQNAYWDEGASTWRYIANGVINMIQVQSSGPVVYTANSGLADAAASLNGPYTILHNGNAGIWSIPTFNAGDFTASGTMTWTVEAGDVNVYQYTILNHIMLLNFRISSTTVGGTLSNELRIKVPAGKTILTTAEHPIRVSDNGVITTGYCYAASGNTYVSCFKDISGNNWSASTNNTVVIGQIFMEV